MALSFPLISPKGEVSKGRYERLKVESEKSSSLSNDLESSKRAYAQSICMRYLICLQLVLLFTSLVIFSLTLKLSQDLFQEKLAKERTCITDNSVYSPIYDRLPIKLTTKRVNGTFWSQKTPSIFQQLPSPEVDTAWERISETHGVALSSKELKRMGRKVEESWPWLLADAGEDAYMGLIDVFHQTHCLNLMRRAVFNEFYDDIRGRHKNDPFPIDQHILHCQYVLLQAITCHADVEIVTFNKIQGVPGPFANFNVERKCRNFDDILAWKENNQIQPQNEEWMKTPSGIRELDNLGVAIPFRNANGLI